MKCTKCGTEYDGNFCSNCGTGNDVEQPKQKSKKKGCLWIGVVVLVLIIFAAISGGADKETEEPEVATSLENVKQGDVTGNEKDTESVKQPVEEVKKVTTYKSGMYKVGSDLGAGEYLLISSGNGYYQVDSDSSGSFESILTNDNFEGTRYLTISDGQYLTLQRCSMIAAGDATPATPKDGQLGDGMYKVGFDIPAGEYKLSGQAGGYMEVSSNSSGRFEAIISNDNFEGERYITVADGQYLKIARSKLIINE